MFAHQLIWIQNHNHKGHLFNALHMNTFVFRLGSNLSKKIGPDKFFDGGLIMDGDGKYFVFVYITYL